MTISVNRAQGGQTSEAAHAQARLRFRSSGLASDLLIYLFIERAPVETVTSPKQ